MRGAGRGWLGGQGADREGSLEQQGQLTELVLWLREDAVKLLTVGFCESGQAPRP